MLLLSHTAEDTVVFFVKKNRSVSETSKQRTLCNRGKKKGIQFGFIMKIINSGDPREENESVPSTFPSFKSVSYHAKL